MVKAFLKRLKSQKGMSGVLIALLLVFVGVGLVVGLSTYMDTAKKSITDKTDKKLEDALK